jgi:hypothetical protein
MICSTLLSCIVFGLTDVVYYAVSLWDGCFTRMFDVKNQSDSQPELGPEWKWEMSHR